ncbi:hypothetical protein IFO70_04750 [Phormidium tenue FACHB-886]|nr:hypothetical protein [Phormidium tenue FACHB-886]
MNTQSLPRRVGLALSLLGIEYVLLGWYLAVHHIFWLIAISTVVTTLIVVWKGNPILESLIRVLSQQSFVVLGLSLLFSLFLALIFIEPILGELVIAPMLTLMYAIFEMQSARFNEFEVLKWLVIVTGACLALGEIIDLLVMPSARY